MFAADKSYGGHGTAGAECNILRTQDSWPVSLLKAFHNNIDTYRWKTCSEIFVFLLIFSKLRKVTTFTSTMFDVLITLNHYLVEQICERLIHTTCSNRNSNHLQIWCVETEHYYLHCFPDVHVKRHFRIRKQEKLHCGCWQNNVVAKSLALFITTLFTISVRVSLCYMQCEHIML